MILLTGLIVDPVLLCNELGADEPFPSSSQTIESSGRTKISVKEAVQIARDNNFMGLICSSRLLVSSHSLCFSLLSQQNDCI